MTTSAELLATLVSSKEHRLMITPYVLCVIKALHGAIVITVLSWGQTIKPSRLYEEGLEMGVQG